MSLSQIKRVLCAVFGEEDWPWANICCLSSFFCLPTPPQVVSSSPTAADPRATRVDCPSSSPKGGQQHWLGWQEWGPRHPAKCNTRSGVGIVVFSEHLLSRLKRNPCKIDQRPDDLNKVSKTMRIFHTPQHSFLSILYHANRNFILYFFLFLISNST